MDNMNKPIKRTSLKKRRRNDVKKYCKMNSGLKGLKCE